MTYHYLAQLRYLRSLFLLYEVASGLMVNLTKSNLIPIGNVQQVGSLAGMFECGVTTLSMKYLGLPLGASYKAKHIWDGIIKKIKV
jgi:hypothetical protein